MKEIHYVGIKTPNGQTECGLVVWEVEVAFFKDQVTCKKCLEKLKDIYLLNNKKDSKD